MNFEPIFISLSNNQNEVLNDDYDNNNFFNAKK